MKNINKYLMKVFNDGIDDKIQAKIDQCFTKNKNTPVEIEIFVSNDIKGNFNSLSTAELEYFLNKALLSTVKYPVLEPYVSTVGYFLNKRESEAKYLITTYLSIIALLIAVLT